MTQLKQIYKCAICGNIIEMVHTGAGELVCCGQPMDLLTENSIEAALEKHIPIIEETDQGYLIRVGSEAHPMTEEHFIEWIELLADDKVLRLHLSPNQVPKAEFNIKAEKVSARAYCNLHGLWKSA